MAEPGGWAIEEYRTASGESPVRTFLESLEKRDLADALALINPRTRSKEGSAPPGGYADADQEDSLHEVG